MYTNYIIYTAKKIGYLIQSTLVMSVACLDFSIIKYRECLLSTLYFIINPGKHINKLIASF